MSVGVPILSPFMPVFSYQPESKAFNNKSTRSEAHRELVYTTLGQTPP